MISRPTHYLTLNTFSWFASTLHKTLYLYYKLTDMRYTVRDFESRNDKFIFQSTLFTSVRTYACLTAAGVDLGNYRTSHDLSNWNVSLVFMSSFVQPKHAER